MWYAFTVPVITGRGGWYAISSNGSEDGCALLTLGICVIVLVGLELEGINDVAQVLRRVGKL